MDSLINYRNELIKYINIQIESIESGDIDELQVQQKKLKNIKEKVSLILDEEYYDLVSELEVNIKNELKNTLEKHFITTKNAVNSAEGSKTEEYTVVIERWYWFNGSETRQREVTTARTGAIRSSLEELNNHIESNIDIDSKKFILNWKKSLYLQLIKTMRDNVDDDDLDPQQIQKVIRNVLNSVIYPDISYSNNLPASLSAKGTLTGNHAENFLQDAQEYISKLRNRVRQDINSYLSSLVHTLKAVSLSENIFSSYNTMLEELENQIKNKAMTLDSFNRLNGELGKID